VRICPKCRNSVADDITSCPDDGRRTVTREELEASGNDPLLGATLDERYTILGKLGAGGMGTVYRAEQAPLAREVALKVLRRELGRDPDTVARFTREAKLLSQLRHPNTVTILDFGQSPEGLLYLAMELLEGEMLSSRMRDAGTLGLAESVRVACGVLRSLDEAHARGIIHRDLKPDNIFLARVHGRRDDDEIVKVVDFGIAKIRDGELTPGIDPVATQEGTVFGTPRYMSPEQAQGKSLDGRSDLYAVGVLLFHMLTGQAPFTDDDAVIVMAHHIKTVPPPVGALVPGQRVPYALEDLVARALAKNPDERPQTAQEFLSELDALGPEIEAAQSRSLLAAEETAILSVAPPPRRAWIGVALGAAAALVAMIVGFSLLHRLPPHVQPNAPDPQAIAVSTPSPSPSPTTQPAPPARPPGESVSELSNAALSAPVQTAPEPIDEVDPQNRRRLRRRPTTTAAQQPAVPVAPPPTVPVRRRTNGQPYQTFEGM
jgi:eukaryotic-like serine/threonine-protein kinase